MPASHASRGKIWERQLEDLHALWVSAGRCIVHRNYPEIVPKRDRKGKLCGVDFRGQGGPDYTVFAHGRFMTAEAKSTQKARWDLAMVKPHQARASTMVDRHGGLALILVNAPYGSYTLPWLRIAPLWNRHHTGNAKRGEASLTAEQLKELCILYAPPGYSLDYLSAALHHLSTRESG